jgi:restriction system protein
MSRTRNSRFEDLIEIVSNLPWWIGLTLAVLSYLILHSIAGMDVPPMTDVQGVGDSAGTQMIKSFAMFLQYIIPMICLLASLNSVVRQRQRSRIFNNLISQLEEQKIQEQSPLCPKCGDEMVKTTASKGPNAGNQFWRCSTFPECKGIMSI